MKQAILKAIEALENANSFAPCPMYAEALQGLRDQLSKL